MINKWNFTINSILSNLIGRKSLNIKFYNSTKKWIFDIERSKNQKKSPEFNATLGWFEPRVALQKSKKSASPMTSRD